MKEDGGGMILCSLRSDPTGTRHGDYGARQKACLLELPAHLHGLHGLSHWRKTANNKPDTGLFRLPTI